MLGNINADDSAAGLQFPLDCGPKGEEFVLSYKKAQKAIDHYHPRIEYEDGTFKKHWFWTTRLGMHVPFLNKEVSYTNKVGVNKCCNHAYSDFEKYGVGVTLYFKFLKYMVCLFVILGFLAIPSKR